MAIKHDIDAAFANYVAPADSAAGRRTAMSLISRFFGALDSKDFDELADVLADDIKVEFPFSETGRTEDGAFRVFAGKDVVLPFWEATLEIEGTMHSFSILDVTMNADGSRVFIELRAHLTMTNGKTYRNRYVVRCDVRDGRIFRWMEYYNPIQSAYAFGRPIAGKFYIESL